MRRPITRGGVFLLLIGKFPTSNSKALEKDSVQRITHDKRTNEQYLAKI